MTVFETRTALPPVEAIDRALHFFARGGTPAAASIAARGESWLRLHLEVGEIVVGAVADGDGAVVRASASRSVALLARFLTTLAAPLDVREESRRHGARTSHDVPVRTFPADAGPTANASPARAA